MASADPRDRAQPALGYYLGLPAWGFPGWIDTYCPAFAGEFHSALRRQLKGKIPDLPPWPMPQQESLF